MYFRIQHNTTHPMKESYIHESEVCGTNGGQLFWADWPSSAPPPGPCVCLAARRLKYARQA